MPYDVTGLSDPEVVRVRARTQAYPNQITEEKTIKAVDAAVFARARTHERGLQDAYNAFMVKDNAVRAEARAVITELEQLAADVDRRKVSVGDPATARRFADLHRESERLTEVLERHEVEAEWHRQQLADPLANMTALIRRFPALARGIQLDAP